MTTDVRAIETVYRGYRFRSRLEARWAIFYDALRLDWEYEPEAFGDGKTAYLPDFYLPSLDAYIEIKPTNEYDNDKIDLAVSATGRSVYVFCGPVGFAKGFDSCKDCAKNTGYGAFVHERDGWDNYQAWCECTKCGQLGIKFEGRSGRLNCPCKSGRPQLGKWETATPGTMVDYDKIVNYHSTKLHAAYVAANTHRFWDR